MLRLRKDCHGSMQAWQHASIATVCAILIHVALVIGRTSVCSAGVAELRREDPTDVITLVLGGFCW